MLYYKYQFQFQFFVDFSMASLEQLQSLLENENIFVDRLLSNAIGVEHTYVECVTLLGPRQVGKTTLASTYFERKLGGVYRDLEEIEARTEIGTGRDFFARHKDRLIILDEIQECEHLFPSIKVHIDKQRLAKNSNCRFLLLGSASLELQKKSVASLTGRVSFLQMTGVLLPELINLLSDKIQVSSKDELLVCYKSLTELLMFRGGMPQSLFAKSSAESLEIRSRFVNSYVENDVEKYGLNVDKLTLQGCLEYIASNNGKQFEIGTFTSRLLTDRQRVQDAISALEQLLLLRVVQPWKKYNGQNPRVSKHTKVYIRDSGLLSSLLGFENTKQLLNSRHIGAIWESFVIESLIGTAQSMGFYRNSFYYRTHEGDSELDFVLEFTDRSTWGIEIKLSEPKSLSSGNIKAAKTVGVNKRLAIHNGTKSYDINGGFKAMPLHKALDAVREWKTR